MTRTYERFGFLISRNTSPGANFRWKGWHPQLGRFSADTLVGAFEMAGHLHRAAQP
jgi:hypothetical protein